MDAETPLDGDLADDAATADGATPAAEPIDDAAIEAEQATEAAAETVEHDIDALVAERDQYRDIALRLQADFENYRKRVAAQGDAEVERATGKFAESLLPVLDACEAGFAHGAAGVEPIWSALMGALQRQGLEAMDLVGEPFDPAQAEAVVHEPGDGGEPSVADVLRTGYTWKGRVLRPAMVKVQG
jgi:molecular chaperone GrpE